MNTAHQFERSSKEKMILALSLVSVLALIPFLVHRISAQEWAMVLLDALLFVAMVSMFAYVYITHKTDKAGMIVALIFFIGEIFSVALKGPSQIVWTFPCTVGIYYLTPLRFAATVNLLVVFVVYALLHGSITDVERGTYLITMLSTNAFMIVFAIRNNIQRQELEALTLKDALTNTYNRRAFNQYLDELDESPSTRPKPISLIMVDLDNFKVINDTHGHLTGDDALIKLSTLIRTQLHSGEKLYRIGGEEFAIAPIKMDLEQTYEFADRIRLIVENSNINETLGLTISIGVAVLNDDESARSWMQRADQALYDAKNNGKNQTVRAA